MRRSSYLAQSVEIVPSLQVRSGYCISLGRGDSTVPLAIHVESGALQDFLADRAVSCAYCNHPGVMHFDEATGFLRLRIENDSLSVFLNAELNFEMRRMLLEAIA